MALIMIAAQQAGLTETGFIAESVMAAARKEPPPSRLRHAAATAAVLQDMVAPLGDRNAIVLADQLCSDLMRLALP
jgi:hypothetical protein